MLTARPAHTSNEDWFHDAERTYTEKHQGCPWCGGSHRVFCQSRGATLIYYCQGCDFQVSHETQTGRFCMSPGMDRCDDSIPDTMCGVPKTLVS